VDSPQLAICNVRVFDSVEGRITDPMDVTVSDGLIASWPQPMPRSLSRGRVA
jgi:hypothetical protein